jgi:hypothetical protein
MQKHSVLRAILQELAALVSVVLFVAMIMVWAHLVAL